MITRQIQLAEERSTALPPHSSTHTLRALITGASGFIGGHLAQQLVESGWWDVRGLVRSQSPRSRLEQLSVPMQTGDVTDLASVRAAVQSADVVFHVAGVVKALNYENFRRVNETGVENVLRACAERETPPTVVIVSSIAASGPATLDRPRQEADPANPVSSYGRSKRGGELIAESYADRLPISIVRPPIVFGEHDTAMLALFKPIVKHRFHVVPGFVTRRVSMIHAADLSRLIVAAAERGQRLSADPTVRRDTAPGYYFAGSPEQPTLGEMGELIGKAGGREGVKIYHAPNFVAWGVGLTGELISRIKRSPVIVNCDKIRESLAGSWTCSTARAVHELDFQVETPLFDRLRQTADFYRSAGWLD